MPGKWQLVPAEQIQQAILTLRGQKVMLDADLAKLYGVETKVLVRAVKRNSKRFPDDFTFQLTKEEFDNLRCQAGTSSQWGGRRYPPYAFTEQGVAMLSSVLQSPRAVLVNVEIMRAFVRQRHLLNLVNSVDELKSKINALETKYDSQFKVVFEAIRQLMELPPEKPKTSRIGFQSPGSQPGK